MSTIEKAMKLLDYFSIDRPEIGLSEFRRLAGRDKATTFRHLTALESVGLLEQNPTTRAYRIGPAVLRLAHMREVTLPRRAGTRLALPRLAEITGETAHASILGNSGLTTLAHHESTAHSARVVLHESHLPLHATASGNAVLAFGDPDMLARAKAEMPSFTQTTARTPEELDAAIADARKTGFAISDQTFEEGVTGFATPLFDSTGVAGAVAVAAVTARVTRELRTTIQQELRNAAQTISANWAGTIPPALTAAWTQTLGPETAPTNLSETVT